MMDILDKLMNFAQISGSINTECRFQQAWYVRHERRHAQTHGAGMVHIVAEGGGYLQIDGVATPLTLGSGDVVFFPRSLGHSLSHQPDIVSTLPLDIISKGAFTLKQCGQCHLNPPDLSLFCADFSYERQSDLFTNLPEIIVLNLHDAALAPLLTMLKNEAASIQPGSGNIINALLNILLTLLIRAYLKRDNAELNGVLKGLQDKRLYAVISAVLAVPERAWKMEELCRTANLSRAQLMRLFNRQIGISPHGFVNRVRLQKAARLLHYSQQSILAVALNCGFQSETNFGKAFKKQYGITPGQYRKQPFRSVDPLTDPTV